MTVRQPRPRPFVFAKGTMVTFPAVRPLFRHRVGNATDTVGVT